MRETPPQPEQHRPGGLYFQKHNVRQAERRPQEPTYFRHSPFLASRPPFYHSLKDETAQKEKGLCKMNFSHQIRMYVNHRCMNFIVRSTYCSFTYSKTFFEPSLPYVNTLTRLSTLFWNQISTCKKSL